MLTRQDRHEIAERAKSCKKEEELNWDQFSYVLLGIQSWRNDNELLDRIISLCDTSNMIELSLDKNGEVIRIGDVVYDNNGEEYKVTGYKTLFEDTNITLSNGSEVAYTEKYPHNLTHKEPVTVKLLAQRIKRVLGDEASSIGVVPHIELRRIAKQLESLGDSDD